MVVIHAEKVVIPQPDFNFTTYNPRSPPKAALLKMTNHMETVGCESGTHYLRAAVSPAAIKNPQDLLSEYSPDKYTTISYAVFDPAYTVWFLSGGTRIAASRKVFNTLLGKGQKKGAKAKKVISGGKTPDRSEPLFKVANWVVQLYDFGMWAENLNCHILTPPPCPSIVI